MTIEPWPPDVDAKMIRLAKAGWLPREIGYAVRRSPQNVKMRWIQLQRKGMFDEPAQSQKGVAEKSSQESRSKAG